MTTYEDTQMQGNVLSRLDLTPTDLPMLPARTRAALIGYLIRWQHYDTAQRCLNQLLSSHGHLVSVYDSLARLHLARGQPARALEAMQQRHAIRVSNSSRTLEARACLAAGDMAAAQAIIQELVQNQPNLLLTWNLQAEVCLAMGDLDGAESAWHQCEALRPGAAATALGLARVWQARGDPEKALLWARTAAARADRDQHQPSVDLLHRLESLYSDTGQQAQAEATAERLRLRHEQELAALRQAVDATSEGPPERPSPGEKPSPLLAEAYTAGMASSVAGAVDLSAEERARLDGALHRHFDHEAFLVGQADVIGTVLRGQSVLAVMPTGGGKSLCYQLAALLLRGTTLVISPLIALMKDQLDGLPASVASQATIINSTIDGTELDARLARAATGGYRLLYAAPERLRQRPFLHAMQRAGVSLLVVDEAHCVSLWGHDFRPDYRFIARAWQELDQPRDGSATLPILAMTATATPRVRDDIQAALGTMRLIVTEIHRPNLQLEARRFASEAERQRALLALCRQLEGSGIIYARSRLKCEELAAMLCAHGISAIHYHAGIRDRAAAQDCFMGDEARLVVATIAFGMGVDKANVRFIIHYHPPKALENYFQEAGRAGRDGLPAHCILFHAPQDRGILSRLIRQDALQVGFLRQVYASVQQRVGPDRHGLVAVADLMRDLRADETPLRVAIHFLETAGLLRRDLDLPRTASLRLRRCPDGRDPLLAHFVEAARLCPGQTVSRDLLSLAREAELDPLTVEGQLLAWEDGGWLRYRGIGRDMLLSLPKPPADAQQRVAALLADYHAAQDARLAEMMAYAATTGCRHGHISAHFGGRGIDHCQACDNCLGLATARPRLTRRPRATPVRADADAIAAIILRGVTELPFPLGYRGLARAFQGAPTSPVPSDRFPSFGALSHWTQKSIAEQASILEDRGWLAHFEKEEYRLLRLTEEGQSWLNSYDRKHPTMHPPAPPRPKAGKAALTFEHPADFNQALFQRLRAWRLEQARENNLAPCVIFHDTVLKRIAASQPTTPEELVAIKGIGPHKLEQYGPAVLDIVAHHVANQPQKET